MDTRLHIISKFLREGCALLLQGGIHFSHISEFDKNITFQGWFSGIGMPNNLE